MHSSSKVKSSSNAGSKQGQRNSSLLQKLGTVAAASSGLPAYGEEDPGDGQFSCQGMKGTQPWHFSSLPFLPGQYGKSLVATKSSSAGLRGRDSATSKTPSRHTFPSPEGKMLHDLSLLEAETDPGLTRLHGSHQLLGLRLHSCSPREQLDRRRPVFQLAPVAVAASNHLAARLVGLASAVLGCSLLAPFGSYPGTQLLHKWIDLPVAVSLGNWMSLWNRLDKEATTKILLTMWKRCRPPSALRKICLAASLVAGSSSTRCHAKAPISPFTVGWKHVS